MVLIVSPVGQVSTGAEEVPGVSEVGVGCDSVMGTEDSTGTEEDSTGTLEVARSTGVVSVAGVDEGVISQVVRVVYSVV
jgi:hypothetical protein